MGREDSTELTTVLAEPDLLRMNVLLTQPLQAVRINESRMCLEALTEQGEARVELHPNTRPETYLREVRALLSARILGSPGGYPLYIRRWTRMGQARDDGSLERLLLLGEPEAVAAVVHAPGLTEELARRAWWVEPRSEHARRMLDSPAVADSALGTALAEFLLEYLPFEERPGDVIASLQRLLRHHSLGDERRAALWQRAQRQSAYMVGFLSAGADCLPRTHSSHPEREKIQERMGEDAGAALAQRLLWALDAPGQDFLAAARQAFVRPPNQDVVVALLNAIGRGFALPETTASFRTFDELEKAVQDVPAQASWEADPELSGFRNSVLCLARVGERLLDPIFGVSDAVGSVMRKRIEPVAQPVKKHLDCLTSHE